MLLEYRNVTVDLELGLDDWKIRGVRAAFSGGKPVGLGYVWHEQLEGYRVYHLASGRILGIVAETSEAACKCVEGLAEMADWSLKPGELFRLYSKQQLQEQVQGSKHGLQQPLLQLSQLEQQVLQVLQQLSQHTFLPGLQ